MSRARQLTILLLTVIASACDDDETKCPAGYQPNAAGQCCTISGQCIGTTPIECGQNATPSGGSCACIAPFADCNSDLGQPGTNGCECNGSCAGGQCSTPTPCNPETQDACPGVSSFCQTTGTTSTCQNCPGGSYDCDGRGATACESSDSSCGSSTGECSTTTPSCSTTTYCDAATLKCQPCPTETPYNCDKTGACDSATSCTSTGCLPECQNQSEILCVKDPAQGNLCVACTEDAHCRANSRSRGPTCDTARNLCTCSGPTDCATDTSGSVCKQAGSVMSCGCNNPTDCQAPYTKCSTAVFGICIKPCTSKQDCPDGQDCDTSSGECYDIGP